MNNEFNVGDVVYLNSTVGQHIYPKMTVEALKDGNAVCVFWNHDLHKMERDSFPVACLTKSR